MDIHPLEAVATGAFTGTITSQVFNQTRPVTFVTAIVMESGPQLRRGSASPRSDSEAPLESELYQDQLKTGSYSLYAFFGSINLIPTLIVASALME